MHYKISLRLQTDKRDASSHNTATAVGHAFHKPPAASTRSRSRRREERRGEIATRYQNQPCGLACSRPRPSCSSFPGNASPRRCSPILLSFASCHAANRNRAKRKHARVIHSYPRQMLRAISTTAKKVFFFVDTLSFTRQTYSLIHHGIYSIRFPSTRSETRFDRSIKTEASCIARRAGGRTQKSIVKQAFPCLISLSQQRKT